MLIVDVMRYIESDRFEPREHRLINKGEISPPDSHERGR